MSPHDRAAEQRAWLTLIRAPGLGANRLLALCRTHGGADAALAAGAVAWRRAELPAVTRDWLSHPDADALAHDLEWLAQPGHHLVTALDSDFPALLQGVPNAPAALFVDGDPDLLWHAQIGIVGSRNPTEGGRDNARDFAATLARSGLVVTSGLAEGIDAAAHRAALDAGRATIAVVGTGPDRVYPARHRALAAEIVRQGAVVSEYPPGTEARREHFPRRNRIIAGLSLGTLVVEAALQSGALITARLAAESGREVFALPGSIHNPLARGCHRVIREGAALVETAQEIVEALQPQAERLAQALRSRIAALDEGPAGEARSGAPDRDPDHARLWQALGEDPVGIDTLSQRTGLTVDTLSSMLLLMELDGRVSAAHGRYARRHS